VREFEQRLRAEMLTAERYRGVERPEVPADALVNIGNAQPAASELVQLSGD
jgi:hypothetical protein